MMLRDDGLKKAVRTTVSSLYEYKKVRGAMGTKRIENVGTVEGRGEKHGACERFVIKATLRTHVW